MWTLRARCGCIEGKPGGVGWRDATAYLASTWTLTNVTQPLTKEQRTAICGHMEALLGTAYGWDAIVADALDDLGMTLPGWDATFKGQVAGHLVCSSVAAYAYAKAGVPRPARRPPLPAARLERIRAAPRLGELA